MAILWIVLEQILSVGLLFLVLIGATIFVSVKLYKWVWGELHAFAIVWGTGTFIVLIIVSVLYVTITNFIVNDVLRRPHRPPVVDASPIAALTDEQMERTIDALLLLAARDYISGFSLSESISERHSDMLMYSFHVGWIPESSLLGGSTARLSISVRVFHYHMETRAISRVQSTGRLTPEHRHFRNDNNTEVLLVYPWMPVSASGFYLPSDERLIRSEIRIGNIHFELREHRHWINLRNNYSTQFIAALVEAMQELHSLDSP